MVPEDFLSVLRASKLYFENNTHIVCEANCQSKHKNTKTLLVSTPKNVSNEEIKYLPILERYSKDTVCYDSWTIQLDTLMIDKSIKIKVSCILFPDLKHFSLHNSLIRKNILNGGITRTLKYNLDYLTILKGRWGEGGGENLLCTKHKWNDISRHSCFVVCGLRL